MYSESQWSTISGIFSLLKLQKKCHSHSTCTFLIDPTKTVDLERSIQFILHGIGFLPSPFLGDYVLLKCEGYLKNNLSYSQILSQSILGITGLCTCPHTVWFFSPPMWSLCSIWGCNFKQTSLWSALTPGQRSWGPISGKCCLLTILHWSVPPRIHQQLCTCLNCVWSHQVFPSVTTALTMYWWRNICGGTPTH